MTAAFDPRLLEVLRRFCPGAEDWQDLLAGKPLLETAGLDSLSVLNLVTELELVFDTRFSSDSLDQSLQDINALAAFLRDNSGKTA